MKKYPIRHDKSDGKISLLSDGKLALGILLGSLAIIFAHITINSVWGNDTSKKYIEVYPIIISLLVACGSTYFAAQALLEQRKIREAGTDPVLVAHLGQREDARELITFNISNVGSGAALNVLINVEKPSSDTHDKYLLSNIFGRHHPYSIILQGKSLEFSLALGFNILGDNPMPPFEAKISYEDLSGGKYESLFLIDVRELEGLGANKSPMMRLVSAIEKIEKKTK